MPGKEKTSSASRAWHRQDQVLAPGGGGAIATATVTIGDTASAGRYAAAFTVFTDNTATTGTGIIANQPYVNVAATALKCLFTTTTGNVNVATQGSIRLFFKCVDMTQLPLS